MQCPNCGLELKPGSLFCEGCGREVQIVPDYDPLDELIIGQEKPEEKKRKEKQNQTVREEETKPQKRIRFPAVWGFTLAGIVLCFTVFLSAYYAISRGSDYGYQLKKGTALLEKEEYASALPYLKKAQMLQNQGEGADSEVLRYLARAYAHLDAGELAAECMRKAVRLENDNPDLYLEWMEILNLTGQTKEIDKVIEGCSNKEIRSLLLPYRIEKPVSSLPEDTYSHYVKVELTADYGSVYYTLDGTEPTEESQRYEGPIELLEEGETLLSAVAINKKGMVSEKLVLVYKLDFHKTNSEEEEE